jgi:hypothetical protein
VLAGVAEAFGEWIWSVATDVWAVQADAPHKEAIATIVVTEFTSLRRRAAGRGSGADSALRGARVAAIRPRSAIGSDIPSGTVGR